MENSFIPKGMAIIKEAVQADNADEWEKALSLYKQGLGYFMTGLKYIKNEKQKAAIREKVAQYMERAEKIKAVIDKKEGKKVVTEGGGSADHKKQKAKKKKEGDAKDGDSTEDEEEKDPEAERMQSSLSQAIVQEKPNVKWDDVAGLEQAKGLLQEAVILPVKYPQLFTGNRKPWRGILLYGPPGTGKSYLAKAVATESGASCFFSVSSSDLMSKFQGESEKLVKQLFTLARKNAPSIIFIDEVDSLVSARGDGENESGRRVKTEFLVQMDGVGKAQAGVLVLGATNTPWELDPAIRRRFEKRVYIPLPDTRARARIFKVHLGDTPNSLEEKDFKELAELTDGYSGADISILVRDALYEPVRNVQTATHFKKVQDPTGKHEFLWEPCSSGDPKAEEMTLMNVEGDLLKPIDISKKHFKKALKTVKCSVGKEDLTRMEEWTRQYGQEG